MVIDLSWLQGRIIQDPEAVQAKNPAQLIEELAIELSELAELKEVTHETGHR